MTRSTSRFEIAEWNETPNEKWAFGKVSRTLAVKRFSGDLEGTGTIEATMLRVSEGDIDVKSYVGIETIEGTLQGREGSFILVHTAEAEGENYKQHLKILPGSGTGALKGISGEGSISPAHEFVLDYELPGSTG